MYKFSSLDHCIDHGKRGFYVSNITECHDFKWLVREIVIIDDTRYRVTEVKKVPHSPPWKEGEEITLMVETINEH